MSIDYIHWCRWRRAISQNSVTSLSYFKLDCWSSSASAPGGDIKLVSACPCPLMSSHCREYTVMDGVWLEWSLVTACRGPGRPGVCFLFLSRSPLLLCLSLRWRVELHLQVFSSCFRAPASTPVAPFGIDWLEQLFSGRSMLPW